MKDDIFNLTGDFNCDIMLRRIAFLLIDDTQYVAPLMIRLPGHQIPSNDRRGRV